MKDIELISRISVLGLVQFIAVEVILLFFQQQVETVGSFRVNINTAFLFSKNLKTSSFNSGNSHKCIYQLDRISCRRGLTRGIQVISATSQTPLSFAYVKFIGLPHLKATMVYSSSSRSGSNGFVLSSSSGN